MYNYSKKELMKEYFSAFKKINNEKFNCMYESCNNISINSHLISEYILEQIVKNNKNKMIISWFFNPNPDKQDFMKPVTFRASGITYKMFCLEHDNKLFIPIETKSKYISSWTEKEINLLNYRAISCFIYMYKLNWKMEYYLLKLDQSKIFIESPWMRDFKEKINNLTLLSKNFYTDLNLNNSIHFTKFDLDYQNNIQFSGVLSHTDNSYSVCLHLLSDVIENKCYLIISTYNKKDKYYLYLKDTLNKKNKYDKQIFITNLLIGVGLIGIFFNEDWWSNNKKFENLYFKSTFYEERQYINNNREQDHGYNFWI